MKKNPWYNFGDANPMLNGGIYVRREGETIEVVKIDNMWEQIGKEICRKYDVQVASYYISDLQRDIERKASYLRQFFSQKKTLKRMTGDNLLRYLAAEKICWFGGANEGYYSNNFWKVLKPLGVTKATII